MLNCFCFDVGDMVCYVVTALPLSLLHKCRSDTGGGIVEGHTPSAAKGNPRRCRGGFTAGPEWRSDAIFAMEGEVRFLFVGGAVDGMIFVKAV